MLWCNGGLVYCYMCVLVNVCSVHCCTFCVFGGFGAFLYSVCSVSWCIGVFDVFGCIRPIGVLVYW